LNAPLPVLALENELRRKALLVSIVGALGQIERSWILQPAQFST
jgi:hypothetical protein